MWARRALDGGLTCGWKSLRIAKEGPCRLLGSCLKGVMSEGKEDKKDGPGAVMVSPTVHIMGI